MRIESSRMTTEQVAAYLSVSVETIRSWRAKKIGPDFYKFEGNIRYDLEDVKAYVESCKKWVSNPKNNDKKTKFYL